MNKYLTIGVIGLSLCNLPCYAGDKSETHPGHKDLTGLGMGAIIGGLIGGPPGAIIGAAGGVWYGDRQNKKDQKQVSLETRLLDKQVELAQLHGEFTSLQSMHSQELQKVKFDQRTSALDQLTQGLSLPVYFRTNSAVLDAEISPRLARLARYLRDFPEVQLQLEAHADQRGSGSYNDQLSQRRANAVKQALVDAGVPASQIYTHAYGETMAKATAGDLEGYMYDRCVNIELSLDRQDYAAQ